MADHNDENEPVKILSPQDGMTGSIGKYLVKGTSAPYSKVGIRVNDKQLTTLDVNREGKWSVMINFKKSGTHTLSAFTSDEDAELIHVTMVGTARRETVASSEGTASGTQQPASTEEDYLSGSLDETIGDLGETESTLSASELTGAAVGAAGLTGAAAMGSHDDVSDSVTDELAYEDIGDEVTTPTVSNFDGAENGEELESSRHGKRPLFTKVKAANDLSFRPNGGAGVAGDRQYGWKWLVLALLALLCLMPFLLRDYMPSMDNFLSGLSGSDSAPTINAELNGPVEAGSTIGLSGTGTPGGDLQLALNDVVVADTQVSEDGSWTENITVGEAGQYGLVANMLDADGNIASSSPTYPIEVIDAPGEEPTAEPEPTKEPAEEPTEEPEPTAEPEPTEEPAEEPEPTEEPAGEPEPTVVPAVQPTEEPEEEPEDEEPQVVTPPTISLPDGPISTGPLEITGAAPAGMVVELMADGESAGATEADADGNWLIETEFSEAGDYSLIANIYNDAGIIVATSDEYELSVLGLTQGDGSEGSEDEDSGDEGSEDDDASTAPGDDAAQGEPPVEQPLSLPIPTITVQQSTDDIGLVAFYGTAEPNADLGIYVDRQLLANVTASADGSWQYDARIAAGDHDAFVNASVSDGRVGSSSLLAEFTVPGGSNTGPAGPQGGTDAEAAGPQDGDSPADPFEPPTLNFQNRAGIYDLNGTGTPGTSVQIIIDGAVVDVVAVNPDGTWGPYSVTLTAGPHEVNVYGLRPDGTVGYIGTPIEVSQ